MARAQNVNQVQPTAASPYTQQTPPYRSIWQRAWDAATFGGVLNPIGGSGSAGEPGKPGGVKETLFGSPEKFSNLDLLTPEQQQGQSSILQSGLQSLQNPSQGFQPIGQDALNNFYQNIVPSLLERFSSKGGQNALSSPVLQTNLSSAGGGLAQRLAALESQYGLENRKQGLNEVRTGLGSRFQPLHSGATPGLVQNTATSLAQSLPYLLPFLL